MYRWPERGALVVDCQADLLSALPTRFTIPLLAESSGYALGRLNPMLSFRNRNLVLVPQLATTLTIAELGEVVGSLVADEYRIMGAIDFLLRGF
ncbi:CcdB family protein [Sphingomonas vulcanisoli]|uniref:CcdB family protein n=1 Tax=Sphingomonas vulcanisoli TaxID=1658060 RepID=UPI003C7AF488